MQHVHLSLLQLEGQREVIQWIPAHTSQSSIGQRYCSDGAVLSEDLWSANQIVDLLAKRSADSVRLSRSTIKWFTRYEAKVKELAIYLGHLTYEANHFCLPDGKIIRDSEPVCPMRRMRARVPKSGKPKSVVKLRKSRVSRAGKGDWKSLYSSKPKRSVGSCHRPVQSAQAKDLVRRQQEEFFLWWRETRVCTLRPRLPSLPTAKQRLDALAQRIAAKNAAAVA